MYKKKTERSQKNHFINSGFYLLLLFFNYKIIPDCKNHFPFLYFPLTAQFAIRLYINKIQTLE